MSAPSAMPNNLGFEIETDAEVRKDAFLFGEAQGRVVVSIKPDKQENFVELLATSEVEFSLIGTVKRADLKVDAELFGTVSDAKAVYENVLHNILGE